MILQIRHQTDYAYSAPVAYSIQQLRLTPRQEATQQVLEWRVQTPGRCHSYVDAWGNTTHVVTVTGEHARLRVVAEGRVQTSAPERGRLAGGDEFKALAFTVPTRLIEADEPIREFAERHLKSSARSSELLHLAAAIQDSVSYQPGTTAVHSTASEVLQGRRGVCQDHAHLFIACCHVHDIPARYVSGYIHSGHEEHAATHAWVDVWVNDVDFSGWVSIDVTHAAFQDAHYCRLAAGRDYESASPVRGIRRGGGSETMQADVRVSTEAMR